MAAPSVESRASEAVVAAVPTPARARGRPKAKARPRIDLDENIEQANKLYSVMNKLAKAAKSAERNGQRVKQRLLKRASKLSVADLERVAVLERCGLLPDDSTSSPSTPASTSSGSTPGSPGHPVLFQKLAQHLSEVMTKVQGSSELLKSVEQCTAPGTPAASQSTPKRPRQSAIRCAPLPKAPSRVLEAEEEE